MKIKILFCLAALLCVAHFLQAQAPAIEWQKSFGGDHEDWPYQIQQTTDGGYIVAGYSMSNNGDVTGNHLNGSTASTDYWVVKLSSTRSIEWQRSLGGSGYDVAYSIHQTADGGYILGGQTYSNNGDVTFNHGLSDAWIIKLNSTGSIEWQKSLGGSSYDNFRSVQQTTDGGYIMAGYSYSNDGDVSGHHGSIDCWIVKLSSSGSFEWQKSLGGSNDDRAWSVQQTTDGGYIMSGYSNSNDGDVTEHRGDADHPDCWIVKLSNTGSIQWQKSLGGTDYDVAKLTLQTTDGGYIVAAYSESIDGDVTGNHGLMDYWTVKLNNAGNIQWQKSLGGSHDDYAESIQQTIDGGYIIAGESLSVDGDITDHHNDTLRNDYWIVKLNSTGSIQWKKSLGGNGNDIAESVQQTTDGGYVIAGMAGSKDGDVTSKYGYDYWIVKLKPGEDISLCPGGNTSIVSNINGGNYQWQVNNGSGFVNLSNDTHYSGVTTNTLLLTNISSAFYDYQYRCVVDGGYSNVSVLVFKDIFTGGGGDINWSNPANWSCGTVPDSNTDVIINANVLINVNAACRSIKAVSPAQVTVASGVTLTVTH